MPVEGGLLGRGGGGGGGGGGLVRCGQGEDAWIVKEYRWNGERTDEEHDAIEATEGLGGVVAVAFDDLETSGTELVKDLLLRRCCGAGCVVIDTDAGEVVEFFAESECHGLADATCRADDQHGADLRHG